MSADTPDHVWFDDFWTALYEDEDDRISAVRLIGEMFSERLIARDGDYVNGVSGNTLDLDARDQFLIRRIEEAARAADEEVET